MDGLARPPAPNAPSPQSLVRSPDFPFPFEAMCICMFPALALYLYFSLVSSLRVSLRVSLSLSLFSLCLSVSLSLFFSALEVYVSDVRPACSGGVGSFPFSRSGPVSLACHWEFMS